MTSARSHQLPARHRQADRPGTTVATQGMSLATWAMSLLVAFGLMFFVANTITLSTQLLVLAMLAISAVTRFALGALVRA